MACGASAGMLWVRLESRNSQGRAGCSWRCGIALQGHSDSNPRRLLVRDWLRFRADRFARV